MAEKVLKKCDFTSKKAQKFYVTVHKKFAPFYIDVRSRRPGVRAGFFDEDTGFSMTFFPRKPRAPLGTAPKKFFGFFSAGGTPPGRGGWDPLDPRQPGVPDAQGGRKILKIRARSRPRDLASVDLHLLQILQGGPGPRAATSSKKLPSNSPSPAAGSTVAWTEVRSSRGP